MGTDDAPGAVYNIGSDVEISINELAETVIERTGSQSEIRHIPYAQAYGPDFEDLDRRVPDIRKIQSSIQFQPHYSITEIIDRIVQYFRSSSSS